MKQLSVKTEMNPKINETELMASAKKKENQEESFEDGNERKYTNVEEVNRKAATEKELFEYIDELESRNQSLQSLNKKMKLSNNKLQAANEDLKRTVGKRESIKQEFEKIYAQLESLKKELNESRLEPVQLTELFNRSDSVPVTILESISDAFFAVDRDWNVTYWNNMAEELLYRNRDEILGENLWEKYQEAIPLQFYTQYQKAMSENVTVHFEEYFPPLEKWFDVSAYPSEAGLSVYFRDVTERKEYEKKLKELNTELEVHARELVVSNQELEQFAFVASHDLQEPLRMVTSFLTQLERKYENDLDEQGKKYIRFALEGATRMRQIILDLLEFSRVDKKDLNREEVDVEELLETIVKLNHKTIGETGATITWEELPVIHATKVPLQQVLQNLIQNGLKYQEKGNIPVIRIRCQESKRFWEFSIEDNGIGIDPMYNEKIFNIFQRLHTEKEYSGTGMGLAICKKIIEYHSGKIWVESKEGKGSTFYFTIGKN